MVMDVCLFPLSSCFLVLTALLFWSAPVACIMYIIVHYTASYWPDMHTPVLSVVVVSVKDLSVGCHGASMFSSSRKNVTLDLEAQTPISKMLD